MNKMKMRMMAMGQKGKEMPFSPEAMMKLKAKKEGAGMDSMLSQIMGSHGKEEMGEPEQGMEEESGEVVQEDIGALSPDEIKLVMAYRKKMGKVGA